MKHDMEGPVQQLEFFPLPTHGILLLRSKSFIILLTVQRTSVVELSEMSNKNNFSATSVLLKECKCIDSWHRFVHES
jgi:hypothetical protein